MSSALAVQLCRIVAPEKLPDRFLTSGIFTHAENHLLKDQVILAYIFEINKPMFSSNKVLPGVLETLQAEHAKLSHKGSIDDQFEQLLRGVNEQLNSISESGETDWIGSFNGIIMVMTGEELHFAQTGRCPAYLLQNNRIRQITDDPQVEHDPHPLKTFSNLASGRLIEGDQLIIANHELYNEISLDALRRIVNSASPYQASQAIARELKKEKNPSVASFIFKVLPENEMPADAAAEPFEILLEDEMQGSLVKLQKRLVPVSDALKKASLQTQTLVKEKVAPKANELLKKGVEQAKNLKDQIVAKKDGIAAAEPVAAPLPVEELAPEEGVKPVVVETITTEKIREIERQKEIARAAEERLEHQHEEEEEELFAASLIPKNEFALDSSLPVKSREEHALTLPAIMETMQEIAQKVFLRVKKWLSVPKNKKIAALALAIILIFSTVWGVLNKSSHKPSATANVENAKILQQVTDEDTRIATAIQLKQDIEAGHLIETAQQQLLTLKQPSADQVSQANALWDKINLKADTLSKTTRLTSVAASYKLPGDAQGFITSLPFFYGWNKTSSSLLRTGKGTADQVNATIKLNNESDAVISVAPSTESDSVSYALTKQSKVYRVIQDSTSTTLHQITTKSGDFDFGDAIGSYNSNVYILDGKTGLLWKYATLGNGNYDKRESVIDGSKYDIRNSVSFAIDGSFYILKKDGSLLKFTRGKQDVDFSLKDQPYLASKFIQPLQVITSDSTPSIYILDGGTTTADHSTAKLLEFGKNGSFLREYAFPSNFTNVKAFDINAKDKKLWILNDSTINEFDL